MRGSTARSALVQPHAWPPCRRCPPCRPRRTSRSSAAWAARRVRWASARSSSMVQPELGRLDRDLAGQAARRGWRRARRCSGRRPRPPRRGSRGSRRASCTSSRCRPPGAGAAASSADSIVSPGMNRRTARRMNRMRGRWSRSQALRAAHRKIRRIRAGSAPGRRRPGRCAPVTYEAAGDQQERAEPTDLGRVAVASERDPGRSSRRGPPRATRPCGRPSPRRSP